jgi:phosphatidylglycerol:prolipoprotein diacylglycerol transferase
MPHGILTGMFFILYAVFRIVAERFREPDSAWIIQDVLTKGQFYSTFMIAIGIAFLVAAFRGKTGRLSP